MVARGGIINTTILLELSYSCLILQSEDSCFGGSVRWGASERERLMQIQNKVSPRTKNYNFLFSQEIEKGFWLNTEWSKYKAVSRRC